MHNAPQYNSPQTVGWMAVIAVLVMLTIVTVGLIKDHIALLRRRKQEQHQYQMYMLAQRESDAQIFTTVQEAQNDFR